MAVEIKELVIRAIVVDDRKPEKEGKTKAAKASFDEEAFVQRIVNACVKEVLEMLKRKKMR